MRLSRNDLNPLYALRRDYHPSGQPIDYADRIANRAAELLEAEGHESLHVRELVKRAIEEEMERTGQE